MNTLKSSLALEKYSDESVVKRTFTMIHLTPRFIITNDRMFDSGVVFAFE